MDMLPRSPFRNKGFISSCWECCWKTAFTCQAFSGMFQLKTAACSSGLHQVTDQNRAIKAQHLATTLDNSEGYPCFSVPHKVNCGFLDTILQPNLSICFLSIPSTDADPKNIP